MKAKKLKPCYRRNRPSITILSGHFRDDVLVVGLGAWAIAVVYWRRNLRGFPVGQTAVAFSLN